jgi:predicted transcriptional regulator
MKFDFGSFWTWVKDHKRLLLIALGLIVVLGLVFFTMDRCGKRADRKKLEAAKAEVQKLERQAVNINAGIANLKQQEFENQVEVNAARANLDQARKEVDEAEKIANQSLDNLNAVNNRNFNRTNADDGNRARCAAFPDSSECR